VKQSFTVKELSNISGLFFLYRHQPPLIPAADGYAVEQILLDMIRMNIIIRIISITFFHQNRNAARNQHDSGRRYYIEFIPPAHAQAKWDS
jgi:hypothetical protein